jgi:hypothetical protein
MPKQIFVEKPSSYMAERPLSPTLSEKYGNGQKYSRPPPAHPAPSALGCKISPQMSDHDVL